MILDYEHYTNPLNLCYIINLSLIHNLRYITITLELSFTFFLHICLFLFFFYRCQNWFNYP